MKRATKRNLRSVPDYDESMKAIALHVELIVNDPLCPDALYEALSDFLTSGSTVKDSSGESLLDRWMAHPDTIHAIVRWTKEKEDREVVS